MRFITKTASILFFCLIISAQAADSKSSTYAGITRTAELASADAALMRTALEEAHSGLYRYEDKPEIDAAFAKLEQRVKTSITDVELYGEISLLLAVIRCDHTKAEFLEAMSKFRNESRTQLPFRFKLFDPRRFVFDSVRMPSLRIDFLAA